MSEYTLTIYKIRAGLDASSVIKKRHDRQYTQLQIGDGKVDIYAKNRADHVPNWASFFEEKLPAGFIWEIDQPGLVVLATAGESLFAITFGQGRHLLFSDCYEPHFGRKVVINSVESVRSLEKKAFDAISGHSITQAAYETEIGEFGFNIEKELLRAVTGTPKSLTMGSRMSGVDALKVSVDVELNRLEELLLIYNGQSKSDNYKEKFGFVDHMAAIESPEQLEFLNELVEEDLGKYADALIKREIYNSDFFMALPDIVDFGETTNFTYSTSRKYSFRPDISLKSFLDYLNSIGSEKTVEVLKKRQIYAYQADGTLRHTWKAFRCLNGELDFDKSRYILSDGNWYRIEMDYMVKLEDDLSRIPPYDIALPLYRGGIEEEYCRKVAEDVDGFYYFNTEWIRPYSNQKYEFCDLYTENADFRDLIHAKRGIKVGSLSHMLSQGKVSCDAYYGDEGCRTQVESKLMTAMGDALYKRAGRPERLRTVFAIISDQGDYLTFFSKVNLRQACNELKSANRHFALSWVGFDPAYKVIKGK